MTAITANIASQKSCYCCQTSPSLRALSSSSSSSSTRDPNRNMDVDAALHELGMLSSVTDGRRQFLRERSRTRSEQGTSFTVGGGSLCGTGDTDIENNYSPGKTPFQIISMNPSYVTSFTNTPTPLPETASVNVISTRGYLNMQTAEIADNMNNLSLGSNYHRQRSPRDEHHNTRLMRLKMARLRRWRKPYEVPWRSSLELGGFSSGFSGGSGLTCSPSSSCSSTTGTNSNGNCQTPTREGPSCGSDGDVDKDGKPGMKRCASNSNTPEKLKQAISHLPTGLTFHRSRSMDDLDIKKFPSAQAENLNYMLEKREIDSMSQHLSDLKVDAE
ncbi:uncharacterized protein LOC106167799 [Lingula anatina]|uniref:Uncharacterized protein LOC106167799 n=1 Tax=Lingula anatina TaxID=7574 RepID=A0A1S3IV99_LINAN|nr:uncharacterized protein LOC106167799 [Lingula anatina]|eukprot:XP_013402125.1 uncharacterized protein LOC106167799 [Lingula anatina]